MRIEDYALIGDTQTAALVSRAGSIDWLCLPRFDSGACFAALLGGRDNGRRQLAPRDPTTSVTRRYRPGTLVLETTFSCADGTVRLVDCMPIRGDAPDVVRVVEGVSGRVAMFMDLVIRFDYGAFMPWVRRADHGLQAVAGPDAVELRTPVETCAEGLATVAEFEVHAGQQIPFVLTWHASHEPPPTPVDALDALGRTDRWWQDWSGRCSTAGELRDLVVRSLVTLKALTYAPTGGLVAAPRTSLPEELGGVRNWDYRYCWLRDATFSLYALMLGGYGAEAWRGGTGYCGPRPARPSSSRSCTALPESAGCPSSPSTGSTATRTPVPFGSATPPPVSSSSTCTARSWTVCTRPAVPASTNTTRRGSSRRR